MGENVSNNTISYFTESNLSESSIRDGLRRIFPYHIADSLIDVAKSSPIGIASDMSSAIVIKYTPSNNTFSISISMRRLYATQLLY